MFIWPVRIYYEDTDSGGVVYHANYLKFMERARTEWLRALGYEQDMLAKRHRILFAVRSAAVDFLTPGRFDELLYVSAAIARIGGVSLSFKQQITRDVEQREPKVLATGHIKVVCLDAHAFKPVAIPSTLKKDLESAN